MIGFQDYIIKNNIKVKDLAKEIGVTPSVIWGWFNSDKIPEKNLDNISKKFNLEKEYINKKVNDISTYKPRKKGFNSYEINGDITTIFLERKDGSIWETIIDTEDLPKLKKLNYSWHVGYAHCNNEYYTMATIYYINENGKKKSTTKNLNSIIMDVSEGYHIDHINNNPMDNRKENLRTTNHSTNAQNRKGANKNSGTGVRNVHLVNRYKGKQVYLVQFMKNGERFIWEFSINEFDEACTFAEKKRKELFGEYAGKG